MQDFTNVAIVVGIFAVAFGLRWALRATTGQFVETHTWAAVAVAVGVVIWALLDATGVVHESTYWTVKHYISGALGAVLLIVLGIRARTKSP